MGQGRAPEDARDRVGTELGFPSRPTVRNSQLRVVVTGAAGFIGSHVCEALLDRGNTVVGIDCFTDYYDRDQKEANLAIARRHPRFTFVKADLRDDTLEPLIEGADAIINEAATPGLVLSWQDFDEYQSCNLYAVSRLIEAARNVGIGRFVQASTSSVYGRNATGDEESTTRPVSPYGVTKLAAEHLLMAHHEAHGFPVTILRYFSIYGPRQRPDMAFRIFCERLLRGEPIDVFGDGRQSRSNTYVDDCVAGTLAALDRGANGRTYNIGGGRELRLGDAIQLISESLGVEPVVRRHPARVGDQRRTAADTRRARLELGWHPTVDPAVGLARQAAWVRGSHTVAA